MALPTPMGGLGTMSAGQPPVNPDAVEANIVEEKQKEPSYAEKAVADRAAASKELDRQINVLRAGLERRMTPAFDPALMKLAAGFLKPTRTGSFGESAGYAAEGYADENEKQIARDAQIQKMHLELLEKQQALRSQSAIDQFTLNRFGNKAPSGMMQTPQTPQGAPMGGAPMPATSTAPEKPSAMALMPGQMPSSPPVGRTSPTGGAIEMQPITDAQIAEANLIDTSGKLAKQLTEEAKLQREDVIMIDGKPYSRATRQFLPGSPDTMIERDFGNYVGPRKVPMWFAAQYDAVKSEAIQQNKPELVFEFLKKNDMLQKPRATEGAKPEYETLDERKIREDLEKQAQLKRTEGDIADNKDLKSGLYSSGRAANGTILTADSIYKLATNPTTKGAFGVLQNANVQSAILGAISEGVQTPGGSIKFSGIEDAVRKLGGTDAEINAALQASRYYADLELQYARTYLKGQGAVSDNERRIVARLGGSLSDTPSIAAAKAETIKTRAEFDRHKADMLYEWEKKNPTAYVKDFERTPEYIRLEKQFNDQMGKLNDKYFPGSTPAPTQNAPASQSSGNAPANETPLQKFKRRQAEIAQQKGTP
jgi:hypothetical protein